ncbi:MAG: septation protein SpoVG family protein [Bacteroidota bacterium]
MKIVRMSKLDSSTRTAAFLDVQTDDGITIKGFRLVNGKGGLFVTSPEQKSKDGKYYEMVSLPRGIKQQIEKIAIAEYHK